MCIRRKIVSFLLPFLFLITIKIWGSQAVLAPRQNTNVTSDEWTTETFNISRLCRIHGASSVLINDTLWVNGGEVVVHSCNTHRACRSWLDINNYVLAIPFNETFLSKPWSALDFRAYKKPHRAPLTHRGPLLRNKLGTELYTFAGNSTANDTSPNYWTNDGLVWKFSTENQEWTNISSAPLLSTDLQYCSVPSIDKSFVFGSSSIDPKRKSSLVVLDSGTETSSPEYWSADMTGGPSGAFQSGSMVHIPVPGGDGVLLLLSGLELYSMSKVQDTPMETVDLYDIGSGKWFTQRTSTESEDQPYPNPRHNFCAVLASAGPNSTTFDIIIYGGDAQTEDESRYASGIWILSIPSFRWFYFEDSDNRTRLSGTSCQIIGPHFIRFGGWLVNNQSPDVTPICDSPISIFNLNSFTWTDVFDPDAGLYRPRAEIKNWNRYNTKPYWGWDSGVQDLFRGLGPIRPQDPPSPKPTTEAPTPNKKPNLGAIIGGVVASVLVLITAFFIIKKFCNKELNEGAPDEIPGNLVDEHELVEMPTIPELAEMPTVIELVELPAES